jgi:hypothetical protein
MRDKLKGYVEEHRDELEIHQPREYLWDGIDDRLQHSSRGPRWQQLAIAASLLLIVTCGTWLFIASRQDIQVAETTVPAQPPIKDAEVYFTNILQTKDAELEQYCKPQPELCREFEKDMVMLNKAYWQLKNEYAISADKAMVLQAMMTNLQMQVQLISRQLQVMETVKQKKEEVRTI